MKNLFKILTVTVAITSLSDASAAGWVEEMAQRAPWGQSYLVDQAWKRDQLTQFRSQVRLDTCLQPNRRESSFGRSIEAAVRVALEPRTIKTNSAIQRGYGLPDENRSAQVSLISHPLCEQDRNQIVHMLGEDYVPDQEALAYLQKFISSSNRDRSRAIRGDAQAMERFLQRWTVFMGCLAYAESLDIINPEVEFGADENFNHALAQQPRVSSFFTDAQTQQVKRPSGVWFGEDRDGSFYIKLRAHAAAGTLSPSIRADLEAQYPTWPVVGLFQFKPTPGGNTDPCVRQWNELFQDKKYCQVNNSNKDHLLMGFASHGQSLNAYCGVQKIVQSFNSQINTIHPTGTDLSNVTSRQRLKSPGDRCVSVVSRAGAKRVYSHFGPLRNSVKDNFKKVIKCTQQALRHE